MWHCRELSWHSFHVVSAGSGPVRTLGILRLDVPGFYGLERSHASDTVLLAVAPGHRCCLAISMDGTIPNRRSAPICAERGVRYAAALSENRNSKMPTLPDVAGLSGAVYFSSHSGYWELSRKHRGTG